MKIVTKTSEAMEKEQFDEICSKLNIDEFVKQSAVQQFNEISRNTILDVSVGSSLHSADPLTAGERLELY